MDHQKWLAAMVAVLGFGIATVGIPTADAANVSVSSMEELAKYATRSGNTVTMEPGVYRMADYLTDEIIAKRTKDAAKSGNSKRRSAAMFLFSGSNNRFDFTGVTIEVDTRFLSAFKGCYIREFLITGNRNLIHGLTITDVGDQPTARGGNNLSVYGDNTTLTNVTINARGSFPYGYGDLLGKGSKNIVSGRKHSGLLICGTNTRLLECKVVTRSFGHAFYIQGGIDTYFENCVAEGEMRPTDEMLAETSGPAFEHDFASVYNPGTIQPGYMKSLNECGFRTYGQGGPKARKTGAVTVVNCTAKNVRVGFALAANDKTKPVQISGSVAIGCERGYYLNKAVVEDSSGDAMYGPLLYLVGEDPSQIDLTLLPETSDMKVHAAALVSGKGHEVSLKGSRKQEVPIMIGFAPGAAGEISAPINEKEAEKITLVNQTGMPVVVGSKAKNCKITTNGPITRNDGKNVKIIEN